MIENFSSGYKAQLKKKNCIETRSALYLLHRDRKLF